jgi:hypothetical protein
VGLLLSRSLILMVDDNTELTEIMKFLKQLLKRK